MKQYIRDRGGNTLGWIVPGYKREEAYDRMGKQLGRYSEIQDMTFDRMGHIVCRGNGLMRFF